jgi:hypothetical protein
MQELTKSKCLHQRQPPLAQRITVERLAYVHIEKESAMKTRRLFVFLSSGIVAFALSAGAQTTNTGAHTISGCLSGPNSEGVYVLKTMKGRSIEVGGNDQLKSHVGHTVKLTGMWQKSGAAIGENESAEKNESANKSEHGKEAERHFKVADIQHVSDSCSQSAPTSGTQKY